MGGEASVLAASVFAYNNSTRPERVGRLSWGFDVDRRRIHAASALPGGGG